MPQRRSGLQSFEVKMIMSCILALFCPPAGSNLYFCYSYTCYNTWVRVINASFDPLLDIVSVKKYSKNIPLTTPLTKIFFGSI